MSSLEINGAFFKYEDLDSGTLNYTFLLPDDSPDYFENLVLSKYDEGFYGYIYRYIPDGTLSTDESFRGVLQQFDLNGNEIGQISVPFTQDSIYQGGRTERKILCAKSIDQFCRTTYKVITVTDYPCHCQYDRTTIEGRICTISVNMGMCDNSAYGGSYLDGGSSNLSGSGGTASGSGGNGAVVIAPDKNQPYFKETCVHCIDNQLKNPCLKKVANKVLNPQVASTFNRLIHDIFSKDDKVNLILIDDINPVLTKLGETDPPKEKNGILNITIHLNPGKLSVGSEELAASTIYHEAFHAIVLYLDNENIFKYSPTEHHVAIFTNYLDLLGAGLNKAYPTLSPKDAKGLILKGMTVYAATWGELYNKILARSGLKESEIKTIEDRYRTGISGTRCN